MVTGTSQKGGSVTSTLFLESTTVTPSKSKGIWRVRLIEADVMGSSGYYSAEVLRRDGPAAFPEGTHVYFDHATESESYERPERSVKDLAGMMIEAAKYEDGPDGRGLFARVQFFPDHKERVEAMHSVVGMSIRAAGTIEESESGRVVTSIVKGISVDIVTHAGAGGRLIKMTESAKPVPQVAQLSEADKATMSGLASGIATLNTTMTSFLEKLAESQTKKDEAEKLTVGQLTAKLAESGLPVPSQARIAAAYVDGQDIDAVIEAEKAYVAEIAEAAKATYGGTKKSPVAGKVPGKVEVDDDEDDKDKEKAVKESFSAFSSLFGTSLSG